MAVPIEIDVWQGEIAELEVDAIIVPANESLFMTNPLAQAVKRRAGETVESEAVAQSPLAPGSAAVTSGGKLAASHIIHAVAVGHELQQDRAVLAAALNTAFDMAAHLGLPRLAMTAIGVERGVFTADEAAGVLVEVLVGRGARAETVPTSLVIVVADPEQAAAYRSASEGLQAASR
ncbi:MAG TPA: macro domain-containing protein [Candidatus Limnocylindria bacterium]|jgi:O-acetyl-ADP-ribose deacetylase (regulator of RNase III)